MMKIVLLMKKYIGLHKNIFQLEKFCSHILHTSCANTTCLRKQQATNKLSNIFWIKDKVKFSLFPKKVF